MISSISFPSVVQIHKEGQVFGQDLHTQSFAEASLEEGNRMGASTMSGGHAKATTTEPARTACL